MVALIARLTADLGGAAFVLVPHWDEDRAAQGIARPDDPRILVYVLLEQRGTFFWEAELPADGDVPYAVVGRAEGQTYEQVRDAVRLHLGMS